MSCSATYKESLQLHCSFPQNVGKLKAFTAYFTPSVGEQSLIAKCVQHEDLECDYEAGFSGTIHPNGTGATITLPDSFGQKSGQFRCDVPGLSDVKSCQWDPPAIKFTTESIRPTANSTAPGESGSGSDTAVVAAVIVAVLLISFIAIGLYRRIKRSNGLGSIKFPTRPRADSRTPGEPDHEQGEILLQIQTKDQTITDPVYLHSVTDAQAASLTGSKFQEIQEKTEADVEFDLNPSDLPNTKNVIIRGSRPQIEAAVRLINQETDTQESISEQAQTFWRQWAEAAFPDLDSRAYFLPPVYFNRVPMTKQLTRGLEVLVVHTASREAGHSTSRQAGQSNLPSMIPSGRDKTVRLLQDGDSDVKHDAAMQRFLFCLQKMSEENREVLVGLSQLQFGQYLGEPCYAAAAAHLPVAKSLPTALSKHKQGDSDVLLIHRQYGIVVCKVTHFGDNVGKRSMSQQDIDKKIRRKLIKAVSQLDKAEAMLSHLVSDVTPGLHITKTIVVPNLTTRQVQQAISGDPQLMQDLCRCLGTTDPADITGLCVCSDQLSDPKAPWDVSSDVLRELGNWWQRRVAVSGPDSHMTCDNYKTLVARFCGPATTVTVPCTSPPRLCVKTLGQAVSMTGECYAAQITLFPEQLGLLNTADPRVFVAGPPGTGKSVVLLLKATEWLRCGHDVHIVSSLGVSLAACSMLYHLLMQIVKTQLTSVVSPGRPHLLQYEFHDEFKYKEDVEKAVNDLSPAARRGSLYIIADEVPRRSYFQTFCDELLTQVPGLHLWAASCYHGVAPAAWHVEYLTRPLRSPPAVVREVEQDEEITWSHDVKPYSERGVADHTDGPPVRRLYHRGQGHPGDRPGDCVTCGREVGSFLHSLRVPGTVSATTTVTTINTSTPARLQWRDMLVLSLWWYGPSDQWGVVRGLREAGIPVRMMTDDDIEDVVTARSDVVWAAGGDRVRGLERKVVVCLEPDVDLFTGRLHTMSRCTSQLVIVSPDH